MRHLVVRLFALLPFAGLGLAACEGCRSTGSPAVATATQPGPAVGPPTLRLYFVSDLAGALEPCGCTKDQLGGLDRFGAWVRQSQATAPSAVVAAAGPLFFMDPELAGERAAQDRAKAETIARVLGRLGLVAFAPGANDWADGKDGLVKLASRADARAIVAGAGGDPSPPFASLVVRELGGLKVGFVGYAPPQGAAAPGGASSNATAEDVVKRGAAEARRQGANVLVALAAVGRGEAKRIADAVPELTAVVVGSARASGDANSTAPQGERVGDVLVAQAANHLQSVAVVDLYVREAVAPGRLIKFADATGLELAQRREELVRRIDDLHEKIAAWDRDRSASASDVAARKQDLVALEAERDSLDRRPAPQAGSFFRYTVKEMRDSLGKDPVIESDMASYYKTVDEHNRVAFADRLPPPRLPDQAGYVGIEVCTKCHAGPRRVWDGTSHAHAYATLSSQFKEFNLECAGCHVTGYEKPGGSAVAHVDNLQNVQCEVCHGPGSLHVAKPTDRTLIVATPDASVCIGCHHSPHVEGFDVVAAMRGILGPGHGR